MYCKYCGRYVPGDADVCDECLGKNQTIFPGVPDGPENAQQTYQPPRANVPYQPPQANDGYRVPQQGNTDRMLGFKPALAATIMGVIGYVFAMVGYIIALASYTETVVDNVFDYSYEYNYVYHSISAGMVVTSVFMILIGLGLAIPSLILGIKSIGVFKQVKQQGGVKPVATLVLGIVGVVSAAIAILFAAIGVIFLLTLI